ncbi:hypothetical protein BHM03_00031512 [Ensete ventricosum]|nr:hypothetical protein BHM03_00031512 [Ensete ventricosum]
MPMNLKEGDRYVVNHGEDLTAVDFGDYVSLAEKEDVDMAGRGDLARGRRNRMDRAEAVAGQRKRGDLDGRKRRSNDYNRSRGCSIFVALRKKMLTTSKERLEAREVVESRDRHGGGKATTETGLRMEGSRREGSCRASGATRATGGQGEEMMLPAPDRGREDAIVGQRKKEAGAAGRRRNNKEGWGSNDAREIGVDLVLVLVQHGNNRFRRGRGALDVFHDRGGRGKMRELSAEEVAMAAEETTAGTSEAMVPAISQKYLAEESTTVDRWG